MKKGKAIFLAVMLTVFFGGMVYALYPVITGAVLTHESEKAAEGFLRRAGEQSANIRDDDLPEKEIPYPELLAAMQAYNERIYAERQSGLCDPWAYQTPSFDLAAYGIEDGIMGVINIPALDVELPIYLGATGENMAKGAAHLSQTSLPIGGENTNCVLAGHCGWKGADFFRHLEKLTPGDVVTVTNLWETLTYEVTEIKIIDPDDIDEILIQPGRDMLTLMTCHPYASGGRYRLAVYCERVETES